MHGHLTGLNRREVLQVGYSGLLSLGLPAVMAAPSRGAESGPAVASAGQKAKSVILVFLTGAPSHIDTFDMKPEAPAEIRGEFKPIATSVPGIQICELLPAMAARAHHYALVRTLSHRDNNHLVATHHLLTGNQQPGAFFDKVASRDDWPCYAAGCDYLCPRHDGIPSGINLPTFLMSSPLTWPGQHAGFLGPRHDPWQITRDPNKPGFQADALRLAQGIDIPRLENRRVLLDQLNGQQERLAQAAESKRLTDDQSQAFSILTSSRLSQAFELDREPAEVRDRYGRHSVGQSLLLARRLAQAGVPVIQVNVGPVQNWDSHSHIFTTLKGRLLPPLDRGMAALFDDMAAMDLFDETLVVMLGEFGRTPKLSSLNGQVPGRDHWAPCFFGLFAGAGVRGGQVIGRSDAIGAYPVTTSYSPNDVGATVYQLLGVDPASEVRDRLNRPVQLNRGTLIEPLFTGAVG